MAKWVRQGLVALVFGAVTVTAGGAGATLVRGFALPALAAEAHAVLRGEVVGEEVVFDARWGRVYTHTFVEVTEVLTGREAVGELVVVRQLGGELDGVSSHVPGTARLELGAEVLLFARTDGAFHYLVGMAQGAFEVRRAPAAPADLGRATLHRSAGTGGLSTVRLVGPARPLAPEVMTLDAMRRAVRAANSAGAHP